MRWKAKEPTKESAVGDVRSRTGFLFLPKCLQGEWRWLERATWVEEYSTRKQTIHDYVEIDVGYWRPTLWTI